MSAQDYTKEKLQGDLLDSPAAAGGSGRSGAERAADALLSVTIEIPVAAAGTAGTPLAEGEWTGIPFDAEVIDAYFSAGSAVAADAANTATFVLSKFDAAGANKTTVASKQTITGQGVTAKAAYQLALAAGAQNVVRGGTLAVEVTKQGSGVATPAGKIVVVLRQRAV